MLLNCELFSVKCDYIEVQDVDVAVLELIPEKGVLDLPFFEIDPSPPGAYESVLLVAYMPPLVGADFPPCCSIPKAWSSWVPLLRPLYPLCMSRKLELGVK